MPPLKIKFISSGLPQNGIRIEILYHKNQ